MRHSIIQFCIHRYEYEFLIRPPEILFLANWNVTIYQEALTFPKAFVDEDVYLDFLETEQSTL